MSAATKPSDLDAGRHVSGSCSAAAALKGPTVKGSKRKWRGRSKSAKRYAICLTTTTQVRSDAKVEVIERIVGTNAEAIDRLAALNAARPGQLKLTLMREEKLPKYLGGSLSERLVAGSSKGDGYLNLRANETYSSLRAADLPRVLATFRTAACTMLGP